MLYIGRVSLIMKIETPWTKGRDTELVCFLSPHYIGCFLRAGMCLALPSFNFNVYLLCFLTHNFFFKFILFLSQLILERAQSGLPRWSINIWWVNKWLSIHLDVYINVFVRGTNIALELVDKLHFIYFLIVWLLFNQILCRKFRTPICEGKFQVRIYIT